MVKLQQLKTPDYICAVSRYFLLLRYTAICR